MAKRRRPDHPSQSRRRTRPSGPPSRDEPTPEQPAEVDPSQLELMAAVRAAVDSSSPAALLQLVSSIASFDHRRTSPFDRQDDPDRMDFCAVLETFMEVPLPETSAILAVAAATTPDDVFRARIRRELVERRHRTPGWLRQLDLNVTGAERVTEAFGDSENIVIGVRIGTSHEFTLIVLVDHHSGTAVKDGFVMDMPLADVIIGMRTHEETSTFTFAPIDRADARAQVEEALDSADQLWPPFEGETWPGTRPLLSWVLATMPSGGRGWDRPEWSEPQLDQLREAFLSSAHAPRPVGPMDADVADTLLWFGTDYGVGDPLVWSPASINVLLLDWIPRKLVASDEYVERIPVVLRAMIPFAHARSGLGETYTQESLDTLDAVRASYREITRGRPATPFDSLVDDPDGDDPFTGDMDIDTYLLHAACRAVGGVDALWAIDAEPLADETLDVSDLAADIVARVTEVSGLLDRACGQALGVEFRTVCRRLVHDIAAGDPAIFRRKAKVSRTAAAIAWIAAKANDVVGYRGSWTTQEFLALFDLTGSVSQRAEPMQAAIGVNPHRQYGQMNLRTPRYLTSVKRANLILGRDHHEQRRQESSED